MSERKDRLKVPKAELDAVLARLIATPPATKEGISESIQGKKREPTPILEKK